MAMEMLLRFIGRISVGGNALRPLLAGAARQRDASWKYDKTGLVAGSDDPKILRDRDGVRFMEYPSLAHSFWRAQEISLIKAYSDRLPRPCMDFGCGDGSFAALVFDRIEYGADNDPDALAAAEKRQLYAELVHVREGQIPLPDSTVASVVSNSVLEHVTDLDNVVSELARVLRPGGTLILTMPVKGFERHLAFYFGRAEAIRLNREYFHRNLLEPDEWKQLIERHGLSVELLQEYQPRRFTFWYYMLRLLGKRGLGFILPDINRRVWRRYGERMVSAVEQSIYASQSDGANVCIIAKKHCGP